MYGVMSNNLQSTLTDKLFIDTGNVKKKKNSRKEKKVNEDKETKLVENKLVCVCVLDVVWSV